MTNQLEKQIGHNIENNRMMMMDDESWALNLFLYTTLSNKSLLINYNHLIIIITILIVDNKSTISINNDFYVVIAKIQ
jgi:hypothetical protein